MSYNFENVDQYSQVEGWQYTNLLAIIGFSDYDYDLSTFDDSGSDSFDYFDLASANLLLNFIKERAHFFEFDTTALATITATDNILDPIRWATMQNFYIQKCSKFIHPNTNFRKFNVSSTSDYTIATNIKHYPTFAEVETHTHGVEPTTNRAWFEFCMHVGLYGNYTNPDTGASELRWGFQYANKESNWNITRPGSMTVGDDSTRLASQGDAIGTVGISGEVSHKKYSEALMSDLHKCIDFVLEVKFWSTQGSSNADFMGIQGDNTFTNVSYSNSGHYLKEWEVDADDLIGSVSGGDPDDHNLVQYNQIPDYGMDVGNINSAISECETELSDSNNYNVTGTPANDNNIPGFLGRISDSIFTFYADFEQMLQSPRLQGGQRPTYLELDYDLDEAYFRSDTRGTYIQFSAPAGATYKLSGITACTSIVGGDDLFNAFDDCPVSSAQLIEFSSSNFNSFFSTTGSCKFTGYLFGDTTYSWTNQFDNISPFTITPCQLSLANPLYYDPDYPWTGSGQEADEVLSCQMSESPDYNIPTITINGTVRTKTYGASTYIVTGNMANQAYMHEKDPDDSFYEHAEDVNINSNDGIQCELPDAAFPSEWEAYYMATVCDNTDWSNSVTKTGYYECVCQPSTEDEEE